MEAVREQAGVQTLPAPAPEDPEPRLPREAAVVTAVVTALVWALFADWGTYTGPLASIAPRIPGAALPWRLTSPSPSLLVGLMLIIAVPLLYAESARWSKRTGPLRVFFRAWSAVALAWLAAAALAELVRLPFSDQDPVTPVTEAAWDALAQGAYGGLQGIYLGWLVAAALILLARTRASDDAVPEPAAPSRGPYLWITAGLAAGPLIFASFAALFSSTAAPADCTPTGCMTGHDGVIFFGEVMLRLMLPIWAAAIAGLAALRRVRRIRGLRPVLHVLLGLGCGGLAFLLSGMLSS